MTKKTLGAITIILLTLLPIKLVKAQEYRQLNIKDFSGSPSLGSTSTAHISWYVNYRYKMIQPSKKLVFSVGLFFNPSKSWFQTGSLSDKYLIYVLNHEQMHFAIGEMMNREVKKSLSSFKYSKNYKAEIDSLFNLMKVKYNDLEKRYDRETKHSNDTVSQKKWDTYIKSDLNRL
jgi:hypothetical protein